MRLLPGGGTGRVRSIEMHGRPVERSEPASQPHGDRDLRDRASGGGAGIGRWSPPATRGRRPRRLDVQLALDAAAPRPLVQRTRVRVHLGTAETIGRVSPRAADRARRGAAWPGFALEAPAVARGGDRFVLRSFSPVATIGGGVVLDPAPPRRGAAWPAGLASPEPRGPPGGAGASAEPGDSRRRRSPSSWGCPADAAASLAQRATDLRQVGDSGSPGRDAGDRGPRAGPPAALPPRSIRPIGGCRWRRCAAPFALRSRWSRPCWTTWCAEGRMRRLEGRAALAGFAPRAAGGDGRRGRDRPAGGGRRADSAERRRAGAADRPARTWRRSCGLPPRLGGSRRSSADRYYARAALDRFVQALRETGAEAAVVPSRLAGSAGDH